MRLKTHILLLIILLISGCTQAPVKDISIETMADSKTNFTGYRTYAWLGSAVFLNDTYGQWEQPGFDADAEIRFLIDRELRRRGMSESSGSPDMIVGFVAGVDMEALGVKLDPETKMRTPENVPQGGLVIVLIDSNTGYTTWLGIATAEIQQGADENLRKARLDYAVTQMLKKIPK